MREEHTICKGKWRKWSRCLPYCNNVHCEIRYIGTWISHSQQACPPRAWTDLHSWWGAQNGWIHCVHKPQLLLVLNWSKPVVGSSRTGQTTKWSLQDQLHLYSLPAKCQKQPCFSHCGNSRRIKMLGYCGFMWHPLSLAVRCTDLSVQQPLPACKKAKTWHPQQPFLSLNKADHGTVWKRQGWASNHLQEREECQSCPVCTHWPRSHSKHWLGESWLASITACSYWAQVTRLVLQSFFLITLFYSLLILVIYSLGEVDVIPTSIPLIFSFIPWLPFVSLTFLWT